MPKRPTKPAPKADARDGPRITLRLASVEQKEALMQAARQSCRSVNAEILYRLFKGTSK